MPKFVIALMLALGVAGWTYSKITRRTGGIAKSDITVTVVVGVLTFLVALSLTSLLPDNS